MKLMFCEDCGDIVAPSRTDFKVRWCDCGRHAVWWEDGVAGMLVLHDKVDGCTDRPDSDYDGFPKGGPRAWVLGIHNAVLIADHLSADHVKELIDRAEGYLFKTRESLIIKIRPLDSNDTRWSSKLP
jgi:hypothetical protein